MHQDDKARHLKKVATALDKAIEYHSRKNESDAALHLSDRVLYSPLTTSLIAARQAVSLLMFDAGVAPEVTE